MHIGIIKEHKVPADSRTPFNPTQCAVLEKEGFKVSIEASDVRCYDNQSYLNLGLNVVEKPGEAELLMGIKEVPPEKLIANKTYLFFSHTYKMQAYNRQLLQTVLDKNIRLIDYELLKKNKVRVAGFGRFAGLVGAYYALIMLGKKTKAFNIPQAHQLKRLSKVLDICKKIDIPPVRIVFTGGGRVAGGVREILEASGIKEVGAEAFLQNEHKNEAVFTQLFTRHLYKRISDGKFVKDEFYQKPELYENAFLPYTECSDILINSMYWSNKAPALFKVEDTLKKSFRIKIISDIACDIKGSVPITLKATSSENPYYGFYPHKHEVKQAFDNESIDIMSISNLPNELALDASDEFGKELLLNVVPEFKKISESEMLKDATIAENGKLNEKFQYLEEFLAG